MFFETLGFMFAGLLIGYLLVDGSMLLVCRTGRKPYRLIAVRMIEAFWKQEIKTRWESLGESPTKKVITVVGTAGYYFLKYGVIQYLNIVSGLLALAYILFSWPSSITPQTRGIVFGLSVLTHLAWLCLKLSDVDRLGDWVQFFGRTPWQLCGAVSFSLLTMTAITVTDDPGLIDTGLGYQIHLTSFAISPLILVGLFIGDEFGQFLNAVWSTVNPDEDKATVTEPGGPVVVKA